MVVAGEGTIFLSGTATEKSCLLQKITFHYTWAKSLVKLRGQT